MGQGIKSCKNLNAWRHLFRPNSASALQGEIECDIYWGRSGGVETTRSGLDEEKATPSGTAPNVYDAAGKRMPEPKFLSIRNLPDEQRKKTHCIYSGCGRYRLRPQKSVIMATKKEALKKNGTLKKGYKYAKGGRIVKVGRKKSGKAEQPDLFFGLNGGVLRSKRRYTKGSKSNRKADSKRTAMKPGKRISKNGKVYYEYRKNRSDVKGRT